MLIRLEEGSALSLQDQIVLQVQRLYNQGRLAPGTQVPSSRMLAEVLRVSRNTVAYAYDRLIAEGYFTTKATTGTFVADVKRARLVEKRYDHISPEYSALLTPPVGHRHPIMRPPEALPIDFWSQRADPGSFPLRTWRRLLNLHLSRAAHNLTEYGDPCGIADLRAAIVRFVGFQRGIACSPEEVIAFGGGQQILSFITRNHAKPGDIIAVENPCNQAAHCLFQHAGLDTHPVRVDDEGIVVDELPDNARLVYVTPSHQWPLGATMSARRRAQLVAWAKTHNALIIEDDYDCDFFYEGTPLTAVRAADDENTIYCYSFAKSLGAGLRIAFAIFPGRLAETARMQKAFVDNGLPWLEQAALAEFISSGGFSRHVHRMRSVYRERRDALVTSLRKLFGDVALKGLEGGTHIVWQTSPLYPAAAEFRQRARAVNVGIHTLETGGAMPFGENPDWRHTLMLGYSALSPDSIERGVLRLRQVCDI